MSTVSNPLKINGVISTDKAVLQNLNTLATASGCFLTYDINQGKWAVIINRTGSSVASFDDSNIIGSITVSETGVNELYNAISVEFPHPDIRDQTDYVDLEIADADRYDNEVDNVLQMQIDCINDPVQAEYLARIELKQNRLSKVITFTTDFTSLGLKAGDLIDVTSTMYGYTSKVFRIIKIEENDEDVLAVNITALEYSADVYDSTGITRKERSKRTGIQLKEQNQELQRLDDVDAGAQLKRLLIGNLAAGLVNNLLNKLFKREIGVDGKPTGKVVPEDQAAEDIDKVLSNAKRPALSTISAPDYVCEGDTITVTVGHSCSSCLFDIPDFDYDYEISGVFEEDVGIPLTGTVTVSGGSGTLSIPTTATAGAASSQTLSITIGGLNDSVIIYDVSDKTYTTTAGADSITEGGNVVITVNTTNVPDGTNISYVISGSASGKVSSPALTGNVTINSNTGSVTIATTDDTAYTGSQSLTFTINPSGGPCSTGSRDLTATVTVLDNDQPTSACQYTEVPLVWCGVFNGTDNQLQSMTVREYIQLPVPRAGEATMFVPLEVSVSKGNPSTITITEEVEVAAAAVQATMGGYRAELITSFNTVGPLGLITGTRTTVYGY